MDETPLNLDIMADRTVDIKGSKTVQFGCTDLDKTRFTVVLLSIADGMKL